MNTIYTVKLSELVDCVVEKRKAKKENIFLATYLIC